MTAIKTRYSNLRSSPGSLGIIGAKTVSLTTIWQEAFSAGYWEQTSEGLKQRKGGF